MEKEQANETTRMEDEREKSAPPQPTDEMWQRVLADKEWCEQNVFGNETLCNAVIARYLDELSGRASVPVVHGFAALHPVKKPRTLQEAKEIVDRGGV